MKGSFYNIFYAAPASMIFTTALHGSDGGDNKLYYFSIIGLLFALILLLLFTFLRQLLQENKKLKTTDDINSKEMNRLYHLLKRHDKKHHSMLVKLENSRENYREIYNSVGHGILLVDPASNKIIQSNKLLNEMCGCPGMDLAGMGIKELFLDDGNQPTMIYMIKKCFYDEKLQQDWLMQSRCDQLGRNGNWVTISMIKSRYDDQDCLIISFSDISRRKSNEMDIKKNNFHLNALLRIHHKLNYDNEGRITDPKVLEIICRTSGGDAMLFFGAKNNKTFTKLSEIHLDEMYHFENRGDIKVDFKLKTTHADELNAGNELILQGRECLRFLDNRCERTVPETLIIVPLFMQYNLSGLFIIFFNKRKKEWFKYESDFMASCSTAYAMIQERQEMREEQKRTEKRLMLAQFSIDSAADSIIWFNDLGRIIYANGRACELLKFTQEDIHQKYIYEIDSHFNRDQWESDWHNLLKSDRHSYQSEHIRGKGAKLPVDCHLDLFIYQQRSFAFLYSRDIRQKLEQEKVKNDLKEQLNRAERLESLGFMATGVAHEINNPMMGIINYTKIIFDTVNDDNLKNYAEIIIKEGTRISQIVSKLLDYSNPHDEEFMPVDLKNIFNDALMLVGANLRKNNIILNNKFPEKTLLVYCKKGAIQQVILNILQNALQSLNIKYPNKNENKQIKISTKIKSNSDKTEIYLKIRDEGLGISTKNLPHIFTPYFTTKIRTEGTGLGLALSYNIIQEHKGKMMVNAKEGKYAEFTIVLPLLVESP